MVLADIRLKATQEYVRNTKDYDARIPEHIHRLDVWVDGYMAGFIAGLNEVQKLWKERFDDII